MLATAWLLVFVSATILVNKVEYVIMFCIYLLDCCWSWYDMSVMNMMICSSDDESPSADWLYWLFDYRFFLLLSCILSFFFVCF